MLDWQPLQLDFYTKVHEPNTESATLLISRAFSGGWGGQIPIRVCGGAPRDLRGSWIYVEINPGDRG